MVTVIKIAKPGIIANHQAEETALALESIDPQVIVSAGTPTPINDKVDSIKIAEAIPKAIAIKTGERAFGKACLTIIHHSL